MNKRQRLAALVAGASIFFIFFNMPDMHLAGAMSLSWMVAGALVVYLLRIR